MVVQAFNIHLRHYRPLLCEAWRGHIFCSSYRLSFLVFTHITGQISSAFIFFCVFLLLFINPRPATYLLLLRYRYARAASRILLWLLVITRMGWGSSVALAEHKVYGGNRFFFLSAVVREKMTIIIIGHGVGFEATRDWTELLRVGLLLHFSRAPQILILSLTTLCWANYFLFSGLLLGLSHWARGYPSFASLFFFSPLFCSSSWGVWYEYVHLTCCNMQHWFFGDTHYRVSTLLLLLLIGVKRWLWALQILALSRGYSFPLLSLFFIRIFHTVWMIYPYTRVDVLSKGMSGCQSLI